jgi:hypothetical protein
MKLSISVLAAIFVLASLPLVAQEAQRGPDSSTSYHVPGVDVLPISGKPFSAKSRTEWTRKLEDGSTLQQHLTANLARDSQGRVYRERHKFMPGLSSDETRLTEILIFDPVAHSRTVCTVAQRRCVVSDYRPQTNFKEMPAGPFDGGRRSLTRESLGSNTIDGLEVMGTRETITTNPGTLGNEAPLSSVREYWYSAELQTNLAVTRKLPVEGLQVVQLSQVNTIEPAAELFHAPAGFAMEYVIGDK